ncbi:MAG: ABC transporter substrate-binding protein [Alphaproteobacteria bacterium]|nr:ABC transporter substrate-binding protein [Alphaproteobacteria bacterium]
MRKAILAGASLLALGLVAGGGGAMAQAPAPDLLRVGVEAGPTSNDPHYHSLITNIAFSRHVFEPLVVQDQQQNLTPGLAASWRAIDDTTWELALRTDARWHDGEPFTADDVVFTLGRAGNVPNSPSSFAVYTRPITSVEVVSPGVIRLKTGAPTPLLPNYLSLVLTVSRRHGEGATTADYNSGKAMIGTGAYRFSGWQPNAGLSLVRNEAYWGPRAAFTRAEFRAMPNASARVAALHAGDVDLIEIVPPDDMQRFRRDARFAVAEVVSNRLIFLHLDSARERSPHVTDRNGAPIANPLRDARVRLALSKAINRQAIVERVMEGAAVAAGDLGPEGYFGTSPNLRPEPFDPDGARRLMAEAGLPNGFGLTIHGPNDRYVNDEKVVQALAQMFTRIGIAARVETIPRGPYFTRASRLEFSLMLLGFSPNPEVLGMLETLIHSFDQRLALGSNNRGRYSNARVDALIQQARTAMDNETRRRLTQEATRMALADTALIPLYYQVNSWAMRRGIAYQARTDEMTLAASAGPGN